eukprot:m.106305 g.106305  ORF g.106305 m.106305 type:complete len:380 (-) comp15298_c0_seq1:300-1439(-)
MHSVVGIVDRADQHPYSEQKQHFTPGVLPSGAHNGAMMSSDATMTNFTTIPTMDALPSDLDSHPLSRSSSVSGRQSRGAEEAHSPRARHQFKVRSRPSSPFRDGSPYRRPRAASSSLDKGERAPSYTQRHQFRDRVYSTPEQTTRQPMNPAVEAARNGYPTAQSRSYSAGSSALGSNRSHGQSHNHSSQTTRRHTVRSSVSNVDDELSSLFNVALGTPSRRRGMDIVPLHQRELPASFWSPKKNPALATSSPQGSPQRERVHSVKSFVMLCPTAFRSLRDSARLNTVNTWHLNTWPSNTHNNRLTLTLINMVLRALLKLHNLFQCLLAWARTSLRTATHCQLAWPPHSQSWMVSWTISPPITVVTVKMASSYSKALTTS